MAWVANDKGRRNIWVAQLGSHSSVQQITHYAEDDGQEISGLAWSADGAWLAYTRGGDSEWPERPAPNPALLTAGVKQEMWLISTDGGTPRDIGEGYGGAISPKGDFIAYLLHGQIWTVNLNDMGSLKDAAAKPQQLFQARGEEQGSAMVAGWRLAGIRECARRPQLRRRVSLCDEDAYISCTGHIYRQ